MKEGRRFQSQKLELIQTFDEHKLPKKPTISRAAFPNQTRRCLSFRASVATDNVVLDTRRCDIQAVLPPTLFTVGKLPSLTLKYEVHRRWHESKQRAITRAADREMCGVEKMWSRTVTGSPSRRHSTLHRKATVKSSENISQIQSKYLSRFFLSPSETRMEATRSEQCDVRHLLFPSLLSTQPPDTI
ncbi:hypothetical protein RRG08_050842 [Elysia crispata]|uniref:Uncharacterized protein n=1 Tax=Elysia crispata TaxID=231223 RepID=A0AAE1ADZ5_9GAST|nr:hypothetical protein RRG08_050842 [Elysia crispata]